MNSPLLAAHPEIRFETEPRWWGGASRVVSEGPAPIPEPVILYASERGMDHGFWRDCLVGERAFDARHFVFSDTPALLPYLLGEATRRALGEGLVLYVRGGRARVTGSHGKQETDAIERHLAVHAALAADRDALLAQWAARVEAAHGKADAAWPPRATLSTSIGSIRAGISWETALSNDTWHEAVGTLRTHVLAHDDRELPAWALQAVGPTRPATRQLAGRRFISDGRIPLALGQLEPLVASGNIVEIIAGRDVQVTLAGLATAAQLTAAVTLVERLLKRDSETTTPYR